MRRYRINSPGSADTDFGRKEALERVPAMLHMLKPGGEIELVSDVWLENLGYEREEVIGRSIEEFLTKECRAALSENCFQTVFDVGELRGVQRELRKKDGSTLQVELSANAIRSHRRNMRRLIGLMQISASDDGLETRPAANPVPTPVCGEIIGNSAALRRICNRIGQVAKTSASVLVTGESGVGKELVVRAIHDASPRHDRPFIKINCAAVPRDLFESEFFGHVKGSFTGAWRDRVGRFELADGGTLFLDEVTETPLELQSKLLRVLEENTFERIGDDRTRKVDVRIVAASNRDLEQAVRDGFLRADLYYRLNVFPVHVPPLRERREDVGPLAKHFLQQAKSKIRDIDCTFTQTDIVRLKSYSWPGNVRELRNVIEHAVICSQGGKLNLHDTMPRADGRPSVVPKSAEIGNLMSDAEWQRRYRDNIESVLVVTNWKIEGEGGAAQLLDMNPSTLRYRIKALGIKRRAARAAAS